MRAMATVIPLLMTIAIGVQGLDVCITSDAINGSTSDIAFLKEFAVALHDKAPTYGLRIDRIYVSYSSAGGAEYLYELSEGELKLLQQYRRIGEVPRGFRICSELGLDTLIWIAGRDGSSYYELKRILLTENSTVRHVVYVNVSPDYLVTDDPNLPGYFSVNCYWNGPDKIWYPYYYLKLLGVEVVNVKDVYPAYSSTTQLISLADILADAVLRALTKAVKHGLISQQPPEVKAEVSRLLSALEGPEPPSPSALEEVMRKGGTPKEVIENVLEDLGKYWSGSMDIRTPQESPVNIIYTLLTLIPWLRRRPGGVARSRARG
ncbi:hypothetical protein [Methanopyrus sp.]